MSTNPQSPILDALYHGRRDDASRAAAAAATLTLFEAAALGRDEVVEARLREAPQDVKAFAADGHTALGLAAFFAGPATVELLLRLGADPRAAARNDMRVQPLHAAVAARQRESVAVLLAHRADVNARQQQGYTPLMGAASAGRDDIAELLLQHGADPALTTEAGKTAADLAREHGHTQLAARLEAHLSGTP